MCKKHNISIRIIDGYCVSYCTICGKIFDKTPVEDEPWKDLKITCESKTGYNEHDSFSNVGNAELGTYKKVGEQWMLF